MATIGPLELIVIAFLLPIPGILYGAIWRKAFRYEKWLSFFLGLLHAIPLFNLVLLAILGFSRWPDCPELLRERRKVRELATANQRLIAEIEGLRQAVKAATDQAALPASAMAALTPYWFSSATVNTDAQAALTPAELAQLRAILALSQKTA